MKKRRTPLRALAASALLLIPLGAAGKKTIGLEAIKNLFLEKRISEAIPQIKDAYRDRALSTSQQKQIAEWLATFQWDSTLGVFEKTRDEVLANSDAQQSEKNFLQALEKEPFNSVLLAHYIGFLLTQKKNEEAQKKILWAKSEMPYMEIFNVFAAWLELKQGHPMPPNSFNCLAATLSDFDRDFCFYVKLLEKTRHSKSTKPSSEILQLSLKTTLPNKHLVLWQKWQNPDDKQKYLSSCQAMSGKQKKVYLFVPEICAYKEKEPLE